MSYIGTAAIGGMIGYYTGAKELLGIQSAAPTSETSPTDGPSGESSSEGDSLGEESDSSESTVEFSTFDWETGEKEGWEMTGRMYDGYEANFDVVGEGAISGSYSAQTEALNNRLGVNSSSFNQQLRDSDVSSISGRFRLGGDLDANGLNHNAIVLQNSGDSLSGRLVFYHGGRQLRWNTGQNPAENESPQVLRTFEKDEIYDIQIRPEGETFTVQVNDEEYTNLPSATDSAQINGLHIDCRNSTGYGPSLYDGPIYFTWDDITGKTSE